MSTLWLNKNFWAEVPASPLVTITVPTMLIMPVNPSGQANLSSGETTGENTGHKRRRAQIVFHGTDSNYSCFSTIITKMKTFFCLITSLQWIPTSSSGSINHNRALPLQANLSNQDPNIQIFRAQPFCSISVGIFLKLSASYEKNRALVSSYVYAFSISYLVFLQHST